MNKGYKECSMSDIMARVREAFDYLIVEHDALEQTDRVFVRAESRPRRDDRGRPVIDRRPHRR